MGCCLSSGSIDSRSSNSALVISPSGDLRPYSTPVLASDVLQDSSFFLCNSDSLSYEEHIRPLDAHDELDAGQIYFLFPISKLRHRLTASEMAGLAVKASVAMNSSRSSSSGRNRKSKISPFMIVEERKVNHVIVDGEEELLAQKKKQHGAGSIQRSSSSRKRMARLAVRSFKLRLSTIYETHDPPLLDHV